MEMMLTVYSTAFLIKKIFRFSFLLAFLSFSSTRDLGLQPWSESCYFVMEDSCCFFQYYLAAHLTASLNLSPGFIYKV